ncbi:hypothetical protein MLD38_029643 [Melastoma candidum]|uniref:Uncharacterized protein n=1 Tax=Melastoma candidum TaxID=119954 RepID=A0ACB9N5H2_9MYRT|nr:hypothetical protein MLD38_029643 [Melastoma candidum]
MEKQSFLDITCFDHYVMPRKYASYMWEACGLYPKCGLDVLQNRSLIKLLNVDDDEHDNEDNIWTHVDKYLMHQLIGDGERKRDKNWLHDIVRDKYWMHDLIREMGREIRLFVQRASFFVATACPPGSGIPKRPLMSYAKSRARIMF